MPWSVWRHSRKHWTRHTCMILVMVLNFFCREKALAQYFNMTNMTLPPCDDFDPYPDEAIQNDPKTPAEIEEILREYEIIPDVLDCTAKHVVRVEYEDKVLVEFGTVLKMLQVELDPVNVSWPFNRGFYYTIILTDPDSPVPYNATQREFHHWLVGNIYENEWEKGQEITPYIGTIPAVKAGPHRFVFVVYEQPTGRIHFDEPPVYDIPPQRKRSRFNTLKFAKKYNLGKPHAVNFFQVKFEDWIPTVRNWTTPFFAVLSSEFTTPFQNTPKTTPRTKKKKKKSYVTPKYS